MCGAWEMPGVAAEASPTGILAAGIPAPVAQRPVAAVTFDSETKPPPPAAAAAAVAAAVQYTGDAAIVVMPTAGAVAGGGGGDGVE